MGYTSFEKYLKKNRFLIVTLRSVEVVFDVNRKLALSTYTFTQRLN
ncbi:hypothetical protein FHS68_002799 [Dyadobacter arcticus]|uniref:Transposase DDE domain-containing protein n=1 Tax=Dyadobacter arcticus TaxID=1078754 RepID=A0ABX0UL62_9BACT|nr:hypothetical protein [Dyadobacter arcticus]